MLIIAAGLFLSPGSLAHAQVDYLSLSLDGQNWSPTIESDLFDSSRIWVPGDAVTVPLWIRNDSGLPADLFVDVIDVNGTLQVNRELELRAQVDGRTVRPVGDRLLSGVLPDATPERIDLTVEFPFSSGNQTQLQSGSFKLRVTLRGSATPLPPPVTPTGTTTSPTDAPTSQPTSSSTTPVNPDLPDTGAPQGLVESVVVGVALLALGACVLVGRDRRWRK